MGIFRPTKVSLLFFPFCNEQEQKLDARFLIEKRAWFISYTENGIKIDEIQSTAKKLNYVQRNVPAVRYSSVTHNTCTETVQ